MCIRDRDFGIIHHEEGIDFLPANIELSGLEVSLVNVMSRETLLRGYIEMVRNNYDYILIDCMSSLGKEGREITKKEQAAHLAKELYDYADEVDPYGSQDSIEYVEEFLHDTSKDLLDAGEKAYGIIKDVYKRQGEKKSTILVAEGKKESAILDAEAEKQAAILRAEAEKEKMIKEAEGQAEAILKVQQAKADGIRFIKDAGADQSVLTLKSLEAFAQAADGKATKIIIPSEIQGIAGLASSLVEIATNKKEN